MYGITYYFPPKLLINWGYLFHRRIRRSCSRVRSSFNSGFSRKVKGLGSAFSVRIANVVIYIK